jgi:hypothetical protein
VNSLLNQQIFHPFLPKREIIFPIKLLHFKLGTHHICRQFDFRTLVLIPLVVQKTHVITITVKYGDINHTQITPRFKWFPQCEIRPLAKAIMKKFTIKDGVQNIVERKSLRPKKPQYTQISLSLNRDYSPKENTKDRNTNFSSFVGI